MSNANVSPDLSIVNYHLIDSQGNISSYTQTILVIQVLSKDEEAQVLEEVQDEASQNEVLSVVVEPDQTGSG